MPSIDLLACAGEVGQVRPKRPIPQSQTVLTFGVNRICLRLLPSLTRNWTAHRKLLDKFRLFLIDEIHTLQEKTRGETDQQLAGTLGMLTKLHQSQALASKS